MVVTTRMTTVIVAESYGGPDVLAVVDESVRQPGPEEIRVVVKGVGVNPVDYKLYSGAYGSDPEQLPLHLGSEACGVVAAVGSDPQGPAGPIGVGDEVVLYRIAGAYAQEVVVPAACALAKPESMTFAQAAGLMLTGTTAIHALTVTSVSQGDTVVIHGASGGVGRMAVQIARHRGARVIGTAGPSGHDALRALGAEPVSYGSGLLERVRAMAPRGIDAALDMVGTDEALDTSVALVSDRARIVTIAGFVRGLELGIKVIGGAPGADPGTEIRSAARLELVELANAGVIKVDVAATFALVDAAQAHRELASGHVHGKIILLP